jgi:hypothetical protein
MNTETIPIMIAREVAEANTFPCSGAKKNKTGPEVNGNPTSQPLTVGPHFRPERLTRPMKVGTRSSLRRKVNQSMLINFDTRNSDLLVNYLQERSFALPLF